MEVIVLDKEFRNIAVVDTFESLLWVERFQECGDFELYSPVDLELLQYLQEEFYLWLDGSDQVMIIEDLTIETNVETGPKMKITGRSLESILDRRIVWSNTDISGNLQQGIRRLLNENVISPAIADRKIDGFMFEESDDPVITALTCDGQYVGDNLYTLIKTLCENAKIGFRVSLSDDNKFVFKLYAGSDRSYSQLENPYILFSPGFENILNSNYCQSVKTLKNVARVVGEKDENNNLHNTIDIGNQTGLKRREIFVEASDVQKEDENGNPIGTTVYTARLYEKGCEVLTENAYTQVFEGEVEPSQPFVYGVDYFMGDVVQIENEYGIESKVRITEVVRSEDESGYTMHPTFSVAE